MAILGVAELAIIGALIVLPMMINGDIETWQLALCAILLTITSGIFAAVSFVKIGGNWRWASR